MEWLRRDRLSALPLAMMISHPLETLILTDQVETPILMDQVATTTTTITIKLVVLDCTMDYLGTWEGYELV